MTTIEFRSDTMTLPTDEMRRAMAEAEVGDDVCNEDPTVNLLQQTAAQRFGKEAGLFVPSGTFANQCAIAVHTQPGNEIIAHEESHVVEHENGACGALAGTQLRAIMPSATSYLTADDIFPRIRKEEDVHFPHTGLVILENSLSDGSVMPVSEIARIRELTASYSVPIHLDGARIFNAACALNVRVREIAAQVDSITVCLSKGLGAPVGSMILGTQEFINSCRIRRKMMGGGMRQVGVLAAPALIALDRGRDQIVRDNQNAKYLATALSGISGLYIDFDKVESNMVYCRVRHPNGSEHDLVSFLNRQKILVYPPFPQGIRFVTCNRVDKSEIDALTDAVKQYFYELDRNRE